MLDIFHKGLLAAAIVLTACAMSPALATANATESLCGGTFWGSGYFSSPGYPNNYPNNTHCTWILYANATGYGILLQFTYFLTEPRYDVVRISDGRTQLSYHDSLWPYPVLMLDSRVVVTFTSDSSKTYGGFSALFTTLSNVSCDGNVTGSGYIESKYYPLNYPHSKMCKWYLQADSSSTVIKLQFISFNTEENYDIVTIYDERNKTYRYSGYLLPPILILGRLAQVEFSTDKSVSKQGFRAAMTSVNIGSWSQCIAVGGYWCERSYKCISRLWFCDRQTDCVYGEDEASCTTTSNTEYIQCQQRGSYWCSVSRTCIVSRSRCDGAKDCSYGEDEAGCSRSTSRSFSSVKSFSEIATIMVRMAALGFGGLVVVLVIIISIFWICDTLKRRRARGRSQQSDTHFQRTRRLSQTDASTPLSSADAGDAHPKPGGSAPQTTTEHRHLMTQQ